MIDGTINDIKPTEIMSTVVVERFISHVFIFKIAKNTEIIYEMLIKHAGENISLNIIYEKTKQIIVIINK